MHRWLHRNVLTTEGWRLEEINPLLKLAADYKRCIEQREDISIKTSSTCITLFYEPSTRTRLSFEAAAHRLGVKFLTVSDAGNDSSAFKGETLEDTGRVLSAYGDMIVIRHPEVGSAARLSSTASVPVVNGGDGAGEHPTQALLDLFTIQEAFGHIEGLQVGFCGDLKNGRTVHSLLRLLIALGCRVTAVSTKELEIPSEVVGKLGPLPGQFRSENNLKKVLPELDVLYMTRIQKERFEDADLYKRVKASCHLDHDDLKFASERLKILHPLPRVDEMSPKIDGDKRAHYFVQAANGVPMRMALMSAILGLENSITRDSRL